jgi:3-deoxy-D-manno-octulosonic acid kinase
MQMSQLIGFFSQPPPKASSVLGGRGSVTHHQIEDLGSVVVKHYKRGGLAGRLIRRRYLKWGKTRSQSEFELLLKAQDMGIRVPEPLVYASQGYLFYRAWLVTREINQPQSLARLSLNDEKRAADAMKSVIEQISQLIEHGILHVDLHPGNVVIDQADRIFLVDFDKGQNYHGNKSKLTGRYISRWQRAVNKHKLPQMLNEILQAGLKELK